MKYFAAILLLYSCTYNASVKYIIDGDSFYLTNGQEIRLAGVDAPEYSHGHIQAFGLEAKKFAETYLLGKILQLKKVDTDKYGRQICEVYVDSLYFNEALVKAGLAWVYPQYGSVKLYNEELQAKAAKIGLWASYSISPYQFRKQFKK